jgi:hypothetical protein
VKKNTADCKGEIFSQKFPTAQIDRDMPPGKKNTVGKAVPAKVDVREVRKSNEAIGLRVVEGRLTLLNRKLLNVLMYHAQSVKEPGVGAPIDNATSKKYFWVPLAELARDAQYDSNDTAFLKNALQEMQDIKLFMETERAWTSERLIASVTLVNPKGLNSRSGQVYVGYSFPPEVHEAVMRPERYTKLSILYQGVLKSGAALALYEICRRYATNPTKVTATEPYEYWYGSLTGNPVIAGGDLPPYKYFKRDTIKPAIAEINSLTDIQVELIEHKDGRRVAALQFRVEFAKQPQLTFPSPAIINMELMAKIMGLGCNQTDASDIMAMHEESKVLAALSMVQNKQRSNAGAPLDSPMAYFRWALTKGAGAAAEHAKISVTKVKSPAKVAGPDVMALFHASRARDALNMYREMDADQQAEAFNRFRESVANKRGTPKLATREKMPEHGVTRTMFSTWYAAETWGEPGVTDIAEFVQNGGLAAALKEQGG